MRDATVRALGTFGPGALSLAQAGASVPGVAGWELGGGGAPKMSEVGKKPIGHARINCKMNTRPWIFFGHQF